MRACDLITTRGQLTILNFCKTCDQHTAIKTHFFHFIDFSFHVKNQSVYPDLQVIFQFQPVRFQIDSRPLFTNCKHRNQMFRISKQLEISQTILTCTNVDEILEWLKVIVNQIGIEEGKKITSSAFLKYKSRFDNKFIENLLDSGPEFINTITSKTKRVSITRDRNEENLKFTNNCKLESLPKGVFLHIGSYLPVKYGLYLSMTSHSFFQKVQNKEYFHQIEKQDPNKMLHLSATMLDIICKNDCIMECMRGKIRVWIERTERDKENHSIAMPPFYGSSYCDECPLYNIIEKIKNNYKDIDNVDYDLDWFKQMWRTMKRIFISNDYYCAFEHLPMSWIFGDMDTNANAKYNNNNNINNNNQNECEISTPEHDTDSSSVDNNSDDTIPVPVSNKNDNDDSNSKKKKKNGSSSSKAKLTPIEVIGNAPASNQNLNTKSCRILARKFEEYLGDNDGITSGRTVQRLWFDRSDCDPFSIMMSFGNSLRGIILDIPRSRIGDNNKYGCQTLKQFFKIFHTNLNWLEIQVDRRDIFHNESIISQLFKNDKNAEKLCIDLRKNEIQLPFDKFLEKYHCENESLPKIDSLAIDVHRYVSVEKSAISMLFNNDKLIKLFNMAQTVDYLDFLLLEKNNIIKAKDTIGSILSKLSHVNKFSCSLRTTITDIKQVEQFYQLATEILLESVTKPKIKLVEWRVDNSTSGTNECKQFNIKIIIENKDELSYRNRNNLRSKISAIVQSNYQNVKQIVHGNDSNEINPKFASIYQFYALERNYLV